MITERPRTIYRAMQEADDGYPKTGRSARMLGVRIEGSYVDIPMDAQNYVEPNTGGMSVVFEDPLNLPKHRRPRSLGGEGRDPVFAVEAAVLPETLFVRMDTPIHALVEPKVRCWLSEYEQALHGTRESWSKTYE